MQLCRRMGAWAVIPCCLLASTGISAARPARDSPVAAEVVLLPFVIDPQPYPGAPARPDEVDLLRRLSEEATARAERTLLKQRLAGRVIRMAPSVSGAGVTVLSGVVRLPVSVPLRQTGARAAFRRGSFATASVQLRRPDGTSSQQEITLDWQDSRWLQGARIRRARKVDDVLADFVRKAVDHAVKDLRTPGSET